MQVNLTAGEVRRLAESLYDGDSPPISKVGSENVLDLDWWTSNPQKESTRTRRYAGALALYVEIGKATKIALEEHAFPASIECQGTALRPDKAAIKVFLDEGIIVPRMKFSQLVFDVTEDGRRYLEHASVKKPPLSTR